MDNREKDPQPPINLLPIIVIILGLLTFGICFVEFIFPLLKP